MGWIDSGPTVMFGDGERPWDGGGVGPENASKIDIARQNTHPKSSHNGVWKICMLGSGPGAC